MYTEGFDGFENLEEAESGLKKVSKKNNFSTSFSTRKFRN
jgi:hypothetical protein